MKKVSEKIEIIDAEGTYWATVRFDAVLSWYLYPQVFIKKESYLHLPSVIPEDGYCFPSVPNRLQWEWIFRCWFSWSRYKKKVLVPYFANLHHHHLTGRFAGEPYANGIAGIMEYKQEKGI